MKNTQWYFTEAGIAEFQKIATLDERTLFIQQFLKKKTTESKTYFYDYEKSGMERITFQVALFLADAIHSSNLPYAKYPALLDADQNPFVAYWQNNGNYGKSNFQSFYTAFSNIILGENKKHSETPNFEQVLKEKAAQLHAEGHLDRVLQRMPDTVVFDLHPALQSVQLKNMWFFGNKEW